MNMLLVTTTSETFATILRGQPSFLSTYFQVSLVTSPVENIPLFEQQECVPIYKIPMVRGVSPLRDIISLILMIGIIYRLKPKIVHSYTPKAGFVSMFAAWWCNVPVRVHTFTGLIFPTSRGLRKKILILIDRIICLCATHVMAEGLGVKEDLKNFKITDKKVSIIGYGNIAGVDTTSFNREANGVSESASVLKSRLGIKTEHFVFCYIGRLNRDKGLTELIKAFTALPELAHLLVVGALDKTNPIDQELVSIFSSHKRIHMLGFLNDIRPALYLTDILVLPSYREGFPNIVLQAGSMEIPVIATNINGCNEIIKTGYNGWIVPVKNVFELERAMSTSMGFGVNERKQMGERARNRIIHRFEQKQHWKRLLYFYNEISKTLRDCR